MVYNNPYKINTKNFRAYYVLVNNGAEFEVGTVAAPMNLQATIYIKRPENWDPFATNTAFWHHEDFGSRFLVGDAGSIIRIHGR